MKTTKSFLISFLFIPLLVSCADPESEIKKKEVNDCVTTLVGDKDGFGMNLAEGQPFFLEAGVSLPIDYRTANDARFTDIYPADLSNEDGSVHQVHYSFEFERPVNGIASAKFIMATLGIQDGDTQVYESDTDIKLFVDNEEIPEAFDTVDQFALMNGHWADFASIIEIEIPDELLFLLADGKAVVRWEIHQLNPGSQSYDAFAIDYCELEICLKQSIEY